MSAELKETVEKIGRDWEEFKAENNRRIEKIEKGQSDVLDEIKVDQINAGLTELQNIKAQINAIEAQGNRPGTGGGDDPEAARARGAHRKAFNTFLRKGEDNGLADLEVQAALTTQSDPDGGYVTPEEVDTMVSRVQADVVAMRRLATVRPVGSSTYKKIVNTAGTTSGWVGEEESRSETSTPSLKALDFPTMEVYAEPRATQGMLDDGQFDVESWLADEVGIEFAEEEGTAFITGTGVNKPRGILSYTNVANASYSWGNIGYTVSGAAAALSTVDAMIDQVHALKRSYRMNASWMMNDLTLANCRKFQDGAGNYVYQPGLTEQTPEAFLGYPVEIDDNMPDIAGNAYPIAFADFRRAYVITDRIGIRVLRDPYTSKPYVKFYTTKRVGGGVQMFEAIKLMKIST